MVPDNHVHLTALSPSTTISLGKPGGKGAEGGPAGLHLLTDGDETDLIKGATKETYTGAAKLTYKADVTEDYEHSKVENIEEYSSLVIGGNRSESVAGDWLQDCWQWNTERVHGGATINYKTLATTVQNEAFFNYGSSRVDNVTGPYTLTVAGDHVSTSAGKVTAHHCDFKLDAALVGQLSLAGGVKVALNATLDVSKSLAKYGTTELDFTKADFKVGNQTVGIKKGAANLYSHLSTIFK